MYVQSTDVCPTATRTSGIAMCIEKHFLDAPYDQDQSTFAGRLPSTDTPAPLSKARKKKKKKQRQAPPEPQPTERRPDPPFVSIPRGERPEAAGLQFDETTNGQKECQRNEENPKKKVREDEEKEERGCGKRHLRQVYPRGVSLCPSLLRRRIDTVTKTKTSRSLSP